MTWTGKNWSRGTPTRDGSTCEQKEPTREQRTQTSRAPTVVEKTGAALSDMREAHRLLAAFRSSMELRGGREGPSVPWRRSAVEGQHRTSAPRVQQAEVRDDARGSEGADGTQEESHSTVRRLGEMGLAKRLDFGGRRGVGVYPPPAPKARPLGIVPFSLRTGREVSRP